MSAAHLAGCSNGNAVVVVKTVSLAAADPADPALRAVDRLSARGADEPSPPPPPPRTSVVLAPIDLICRIESCFTDVGLQLWRCSVLLAEFMASWGRAGATAACRHTGGAGLLDNAEEEVALLRKRCGGGGGGDNGGVKAFTWGDGARRYVPEDADASEMHRRRRRRVRRLRDDAPAFLS